MILPALPLHGTEQASSEPGTGEKMRDPRSKPQPFRAQCASHSATGAGEVTHLQGVSSFGRIQALQRT
eukprot:7566234-Alexandrium_andersonii.AAC.1